MNAKPQENLKITLEEYFEVERNSEIKHEYFDGEIFAMTGASLNHNRISRNIAGELTNMLKSSSCENFTGDMRVKVEAIEKYTYPDIVVVCGEIELEEKGGVDTLLNPIVIIEILSESTEAYDRGDKFSHYRLISSLCEYILVSQKRCQVEKYVRGDKGVWLYSSYEGIKQTAIIESIKCELPLSGIYYQVAFEK